MGSLKLYVDDQVENSFRRAAMKKFGYGRGALSRAAEEALARWSEGSEISDELLDTVQDPVSTIEGLLKHVKGVSSVDLQKQASKIRAKRTIAKSASSASR